LAIKNVESSRSAPVRNEIRGYAAEAESQENVNPMPESQRHSARRAAKPQLLKDR
jgi:hypothetical protein